MKWISLLILLGYLLTACSPSCSEEIKTTFRAAEEGDLVYMQAYFEAGGDPMLACTDYSGKGFWPDRYLGHGVSQLHDRIFESGSMELMSLYLQQDLPDGVKDDLFAMALDMEALDMARLLMQHDAHLQEELPYGLALYGDLGIPVLQRAFDLGYDLDWQNRLGNTLFMQLCKYDLAHGKPALLELVEGGLSEDQDYFVKLLQKEEKRELEMIRTLDFMINLGVDTGVENLLGRNAIELCASEQVKAFLIERLRK